jgi:hypothetical protein
MKYCVTAVVVVALFSSVSRSDDLAAATRLLNKDTPRRTREELAEKVFFSCYARIRDGKRSDVVALFDKLMILLDDKDGLVVFWVTKCMAALGKDGKRALPKLEKLRSVWPRVSGEPARSGIEFAIEQIAAQ